MAFDVEEFRANLSDGGYLKPHDFFVTIVPPPILRGKTITALSGNQYQMGAEEIFNYRADSVRAPGVLIATSDVQRYGIGPIQKTPFNVVFSDNSISFIPDSDGFVWAFFYSWINSIFAYGDEHATPGAAPRRASNELEYRAEYQSTIKVDVLDPRGSIVQTIMMYQAYPNMMPDVPLSWGAHDQLLKLTVSFTFRDWSLVNVDATDAVQQPTGVPANQPVLQRLGAFSTQGAAVTV